MTASRRKHGVGSQHTLTEPLEVVPTAHGYDRWSEIYDADDNPLVRLEEKHVRRLIGKVAGLSIADIGCGTGRHALPLAAAGGRVTAVDFSAGMLSRARAKRGAEAVKFVRHDLTTRLPLASAAFDRVLCCLVLDHVPKLEPFFRELRRLCRPDGVIVASVVHPAMLLRGVQARFSDPTSGRRVGPRSYPHQLSEYVMAALRAGLSFDHLSEHPVDAALAAESPRAVKYLGWPLLLVMQMRKSPAPRG